LISSISITMSYGTGFREQDVHGGHAAGDRMNSKADVHATVAQCLGDGTDHVLRLRHRHAVTRRPTSRASARSAAASAASMMTSPCAVAAGPFWSPVPNPRR
jgi:hypothetical protein